jgi:hypothetical protein
MTLARIFLAAMLPVLIVCGSCDPRSHVEAGRIAVEQFHRHYNARQYVEMYNQCGPAVRKSTSQQDFVRYEDGVRRKLGEFKSAEVFNYNVLYLLHGPQVRLDYHCVYANGKTTESFEIDFKNGRPVIDGYRIDTPLLKDQGGRADVSPQTGEGRAPWV